VLVHRFARLPLIVWSLIVSLLCWALATSTAWADAQTDRFQAYARDLLQKPYNQTPFPCSTIGAKLGQDRHIVDMPPWAEASGLRRGDLLVALGGTPLTGTRPLQEVWAQVPHGENVEIRVERAGNDAATPRRSQARPFQRPPEWVAEGAGATRARVYA
jgi:hypothetical protein